MNLAGLLRGLGIIYAVTIAVVMVWSAILMPLGQDGADVHNNLCYAGGFAMMILTAVLQGWGD